MNGKKTYAVVVGGLLVVGGLFLQGQIDVSEAVNQALVLLGIAGVRHGVATKS
jgi:hypothetical protein